MCGIAGQVTADRRPVDPGLIKAMGERLRHRGPDDSGVYINGHVGLAHQRLSVLDLSPAGHQPMTNEDSSVLIVFNGEIYNFAELRASIQSRHAFRSRTDTEVILHLYEEYGVECVRMLRGMFAFAIWDQAAQRLVLARDRLGKKPLFYRLDDRGLCFASELKALLIDEAAPDINPVAMHHYLTFQYVPAPWTIFTPIRKLRPGHMLIYEEGKVSDNAYWSLRYDPKCVRRNEAEYREEFARLLEESVRLRLVSDVPLGAFLSGGMDSSTVVALMSREMTKPVKTFSIGFKDEAFNELPYARDVAKLYGTEHHEFVVEPSAIELLPTLVRVYDEPYADPSAMPTYYVSQLSRQFVTVALNGDGGDELLAGYPRYQLSQGDRLKTWFLPIAGRPSTGRDRLQKFLRRLPRCVPGGRVRRRLQHLAEPFHNEYLGRICYFLPSEKEGLYASEFHTQVHGHDSADLLLHWFEETQASDLLDQLLGVDTLSYLPDDLLVKVDRATMAHGLEARSPFLDHQLVEFVASLPVHLKVRNGETKYLLKSVMAGVLPDRILRRAKQGFGVPIDRWFRGDCRDFLRDILLSTNAMARGYFRPERVKWLIDEHQKGTTDYSTRLYALLMLELWHREYVDGARA